MNQDKRTFWSISNGKLSPEILDVYIFLMHRGYTKRTISDEIELYRQNGHFVDQCFTSDHINEVTAYLQKEYKAAPDEVEITIDYPRKGVIEYSYSNKAILEKIVKYGWGKIFNDKNFNHLPELSVSIKKHTKEAAFFYFKNGYVKVTPEGSQLFPYSTIDGQYIYKDFLINRDIKIMDINDPVIQEFCPRGFKFFDFLNRIAGVPENVDEATQEQANKLKYLLQCLGFMLHDYKQQGLTDFGLILCDDNIGGSGKGILIQALRQMTKVTEIDAKKEERFDPEELTERTRIKVYNDIEPSFHFPLVYNEITDQAVIRSMYKSPRYVPYKDAWKVLFTSNHIIRGNSGADNRRQRVFSLASFFNKEYTPRDHYNHSFFSEDWNTDDWNFFYSIMFECAKFWLATDYKLAYTDVDYAERKMEEEYPFEFREYVELLIAEVKTNGTQFIKLSDFYYKFKENDRYKLNPFVRKLEIKLFSRLLRRYLDGSPSVKYSRNHNRSELTIWKK